MKKLLISALMLVSWNAMAIEVPGKVFYELPNGEMAKREVTIDVPARGMGEVVLRGENFTWRTHKFMTEFVAGRKVFSVAFMTEWQGMLTEVTLSGTYIRSKDKVLYYGDMYKQTQGRPIHFSGGFFFKYDRETEEE